MLLNQSSSATYPCKKKQDNKEYQVLPSYSMPEIYATVEYISNISLNILLSIEPSTAACSTVI